ncbi:hypothetical protein P2P98_13990 [Microbacterium sp. Kw_RZR3]|uniref:hypothetical protein n=1 Tax=Microbacterium sp. Kw_RZR3 TaxID=3032903 RepID=UPI0023DACFCB|nr:hypothetical protein [Microbacterium sp. Kw_RZR3]MDF2047273.1 hypothetical protein [Microbacterium sp. Kw_RZR3]
MGTNRRYADAIDRRMGDKIFETISRSGPLQSLTPMELRLDQVPLTIDPRPRRKVKAWVRFGSTPVRVDALVARWTPDAVGIVLHAGHVEHRCWVWVGAVDEVM